MSTESHDGIPSKGFYFDHLAHRYYIDGRRVPSVTEVLEPLQELDGIPRAQLEAARDLGQKVHKAIFLALHKTLEWSTLDPLLVGYVQAAQLCIAENKIRMLAAEYPVHDPQTRVAGMLDMLGVKDADRRTGLFDWKAVSVMHRSAGPQTAGYDYMYRRTLGGMSDRRGFDRYGVQLFPDGKYRLYKYDDSRDLAMFISCVNIWHWRNS